MAMHLKAADDSTPDGLNRIDELLHNLLDYKEIAKSDKSIQASLYLLERRLVEEELRHEPIEAKIEMVKLKSS